MTDHIVYSMFARERMLEMDRFVTDLSGSEDERLVRPSTWSHATMKEQGGTLSRYVYRNVEKYFIDDEIKIFQKQ